ncbi:hypothetical protein C8A00DRAFT_37207 [Chaetomidium leptoderma]|uniref:Uncharacterized protein n=1 Tax=Chaetomidium leptoderma TaxID=669021 RepID=A0AAN6ZTD0_9PEZI|nr:hypothetical protein C8A00DRAFT_37207 [Chaetomidium leptoderma]
MVRSDASYNRYSDYSEVMTDDLRKCQVEGCHRRHAFARDDSGRKVYSRYCSDHTCAKEYPEDEGAHCATPRKLGDRYCPDHQKCDEPLCTKMGENVGGRDYIRWVCIDHRCTFPNCRARATDRQQRRCDAHFTECAVPDCKRPCHLGRNGQLDQVCAVHYGNYRCLHTDCPRFTGSRYCAAHRCAVRDCPAARHAAGGGDACPKHLCTSAACTRAVLYPSRPRAAHCVVHTCKTPSCASPRDGASDFCLAHTCAAPTCRAEARFPDGHCPARHACVVVTCPRPRLSAVPSSTLGVGLDRDRCAVHARARERRSASLDVDGLGLDWEGLRGRFDMSGERERERERHRLSDDLERLRRMEREREATRTWADVRGGQPSERPRETERERLERLQTDMEDWRRRYPSWDGW